MLAAGRVFLPGQLHVSAAPHMTERELRLLQEANRRAREAGAEAALLDVN